MEPLLCSSSRFNSGVYMGNATNKGFLLAKPQRTKPYVFAFYRELALPGQDLGISYDDFAPTQRRNL